MWVNMCVCVNLHFFEVCKYVLEFIFVCKDKCVCKRVLMYASKNACMYE